MGVLYPCILRRTQIYLGKAEAVVLDRVAKRTGRTRSSLIREAIVQCYGTSRDREETLRVLRETAGAWNRAPRDETEDSVEFVKRTRGPGVGHRPRALDR